MRRVVRLYGRPDCGLCTEVRQALVRLRPRFRFTLEEVDIDTDPEAHDRFFLEIPVVEVDGEVIARAPISPATLEAALADTFGQR